jgi:hypothetical protein
LATENLVHVRMVTPDTPPDEAANALRPPVRRNP